MERRGSTNCLFYLDDFFIAEESFNKCMEAIKTLTALLQRAMRSRDRCAHVHYP